MTLVPFNFIHMLLCYALDLDLLITGTSLFCCIKKSRHCTLQFLVLLLNDVLFILMLLVLMLNGVYCPKLAYNLNILQWFLVNQHLLTSPVTSEDNRLIGCITSIS